MSTTLWIVQIVLAAMFLMGGMMKLTKTKEQLAEKMAWAEDFTQGQIRGIGMLETLGALGLVLPSGLGILPWLTPMASAGLAVVMLGAILTHLKRKEVGQALVPLVLAGMLVFVTLGRWEDLPF